MSQRSQPDSLGTDLDAFIREHEYCDELDTGIAEDLFWMTCTCGAVISRTLEPFA